MSILRIAYLERPSVRIGQEQWQEDHVVLTSRAGWDVKTASEGRLRWVLQLFRRDAEICSCARQCDARGPICGNCEKRNIVCEYADFTVNRPNSAPPWEQSGSQVRSKSSRLAIKHLLTEIFHHVFSITPAQPKSVTGEIQFDQLELMHQWTTSTSISVIRVTTPDIKDLWQVTVPQLAQNQRFIMHSILSLSAAHLAYLRPMQRDQHQQVARQHHVDASAAFRNVSSSGIERPSHESVLIFCILHMVAALALLPVGQNEVSDLEHFVSWLMLLRTTLKLAHAYNWDPNNPNSDLQNIMGFFAQSPPPQLKPDPGLQASLSKLEAFNASASPPNDKPVFSEAIAQTKLWFTLVPLHPPNLLFLLRWVIQMPDAYLDLITKRSSLALVLLAHWIIPLRNAPRKWMVGEWPERAIDAIRKQVGDAWTSTMGWVVEQIEGEITYTEFDDFGPVPHPMLTPESATSEDSHHSPDMMGIDDGHPRETVWRRGKWGHLW